MAVDGSGDVFIADTGNNRVVEVKPDGTQTTVGSGLSYPDGVAVDGVGRRLHRRHWQQPGGGGDRGRARDGQPGSRRRSRSAPPAPRWSTGSARPSPRRSPPPAATDPDRRRRHGQLLRRHDAAGHRDALGQPGDGHLTTAALAVGPHTITARYSGDSNFAASASGVEPASVQSVVPASGLLPQGVAVDGSGDVFIADSGNNRVVEVKADGTADHRRLRAQSPHGRGGGRRGRRLHRRLRQQPGAGGAGRTAPRPPSAPGSSTPRAWRWTASGDVFIADTDNNQVVEVPARRHPDHRRLRAH